MNLIEIARYVKSAYEPIRILTALAVLGLVVLTSMVFAPICVNKLPLMLWTPFDQYESLSTYMAMYVLDTICATVIGLMVTCFNTYLLLVLVCLNFNYELLGERAARIGHQSSHKRGKQSETYGPMIELIKLHMKMNR